MKAAQLGDPIYAVEVEMVDTSGYRKSSIYYKIFKSLTGFKNDVSYQRRWHPKVAKAYRGTVTWEEIPLDEVEKL